MGNISQRVLAVKSFFPTILFANQLEFSKYFALNYHHYFNISTVLSSHKYLESIIIYLFCIVIPAEAEIKVDSRSWSFWMPDQVRHDGEFWTVELI